MAKIRPTTTPSVTYKKAKPAPFKKPPTKSPPLPKRRKP